VNARTARPGGERLVNGQPRQHPDARRVWAAQRALQAKARGQRQKPATEANPGAERVSEAQAALGGRVFRIPSETLGPLRHRIEALDRRATKLGTGPIRLWDTGERDSAGHAFVVLYGTAPVLAGWALAAIVEHRDDAATVRAVSDLGARLDPAAFQTPWCEHCGLRRRRNATFVVVHVDSGELRQVGSGCLRDFLGGHDPERACRQAEYLALARDELEGAENMTRPPEPMLEAFAAHAAHVVRAHAFVSRERARRASEPASADLALRSLHETPDAPDRSDRALANGALGWARALPTLKDELSQFETDALTVIESRRVNTRREGGLICALIAAYRQRRARSRHLAQPAQRLGIVVLVERVIPVPSERYGTMHRCELIDANVNRLAWWQTRGAPMQPGAVVSLEGTVERHTRFGAAALTVLSHCTTEILAGPEGVSMLDPVLDL
jgi:hypothetical protein